jgi:hypothetical protein
MAGHGKSTMTPRSSSLFAIIASMAVAGFASQSLPLNALPKAIAVGLIAAAAFALTVSATGQKRNA